MFDIYTLVWSRRALVHFLVKGEHQTSSSKAILGQLWLLLNPLAQILIYYFLIVIIFKSTPRDGVDPLIPLVVGITHYIFLNQAITGSSGAVLDNQGLLMQSPIEPLFFIAAGFWKDLNDFFFSFIVMALFYVWLGPVFTAKIIFYPFLVMILFLYTWCFSILQATVIVFFRDLKSLTPILMRLMMYVCPVVYGIDFYPDGYLSVLMLNPLATIFALLKWSLNLGDVPPSSGIILLLVLSAILVGVSHLLYFRLRSRFTKAF